jgi:hypothetical protein
MRTLIPLLLQSSLIVLSVLHPIVAAAQSPVAAPAARRCTIQELFQRDIPVASHPAMYNLAAKFQKIGTNPNPLYRPGRL